MYQKWTSIETPFKKYELLTYVRVHTYDLYIDMLQEFPGLTGYIDKYIIIYLITINHLRFKNKSK